MIDKRQSGPLGTSTNMKLVAVVTWLSLSVALSVWFTVFALKQANQIAQFSAGVISAPIAQDVARRHRMLMSEGATLVVLLLAGGGALIYFIRTELNRNRRVREFFATFTHELKTSMARIRLQAESLEADLIDEKEMYKKEMAVAASKRLVQDTVRLELQLENSLFLSSDENENRLLIEDINLTRRLENLKSYWSDLNLQLQFDLGENEDCLVRADARALESVLKNILQNAVLHGNASSVQITVSASTRDICIRFADDGKGFAGSLSELGKMFHRHTSSSGTGLGLYIARTLCARMGGRLAIPQQGPGGFALEVYLPRSEAGRNLETSGPGPSGADPLEMADESKHHREGAARAYPAGRR